MGLTFVTATVSNPANTKKTAKVDFLVDSGAIFSVISQETLRKLGVKPHSKKSFTLANGEAVERSIGDLAFEYAGERGASPVIFGEKGDSSLMGAVTLEALGLMLDPLKREIRSLPMVLGSMRKHI